MIEGNLFEGILVLFNNCKRTHTRLRIRILMYLLQIFKPSRALKMQKYLNTALLALQEFAEKNRNKRLHHLAPLVLSFLPTCVCLCA